MKLRTVSILSLTLFGASTALAQPAQTNTQVERFDRQLETIRRSTRLQVNPEVPIGQRAYFDYGGYISTSYLSLDDPSLKNTGFWQYEVGAYADLVFDGANEIFFRGHLFHRDFNPGDRFNSDGENIDGRLDRLYYKFDLARFQEAYRGRQSPGDVTIKIGRDLALWGNGLTLSTELDGGVVDLNYDVFNLEILAGVTPLDTVDFDSARPRFDSRTERFMYGALGSMRAGVHRLYAYGLIQRDYNNDELVEGDMINGQPVTPTRFHYDSHYIGVGAQGALTDRLSYGIEGVYEGGHTLSSSFVNSVDPLTGKEDPTQTTPVEQTRDRIEAFALDGRLDYVIPNEHAIRLSGETLLASGDADRVSSTTTTYGGNTPGTVDHAFNAFGLPDVGVAFSPAASNLLMFRVGATGFPFPQYKPLRRMQIGTDFYTFAKLSADGPIDEPTSNSRWLGVEPDIYLNWQITSDIALSVRYGVFIPGDAVVNDGKLRQFLFTGVTVAF
jgi:hypothetical protein